MARNVEIKARIEGVDVLRPRAALLATEGPFEIRQEDTFFRCRSGRLKLRDFGDGTGELIFYRRPDRAGPSESYYLRSRTSTPDVLRLSLSEACGEAGRVLKQRTLFLVGRTRIHLDRVQGLGDFLELEVVLDDDEPTTNGEAEARTLMDRLGIEGTQLVAEAYVDLLAARTTTTVRVAVRGDVPEIQRVRHAVRENRLTSRTIGDAEVVDAIERRGRGWVAEADGRIVGFAIGKADDGNVWALFVEPGWEHRGIGRRLHDAMVEWLWSGGLRLLWLTTEAGTRAEGFYRRAGWHAVRHEPGGEIRFERTAR
jgi:adenylate cyclase